MAVCFHFKWGGGRAAWVCSLAVAFSFTADQMPDNYREGLIAEVRCEAVSFGKTVIRLF